jgi:hypothetical protein
VRRLEGMESLKRVDAPFSGVITQRIVDAGSWFNAGNGGTAVKGTFDLAQTELARIRGGPIAGTLESGFGHGSETCLSSIARKCREHFKTRLRIIHRNRAATPKLISLWPQDPGSAEGRYLLFYADSAALGAHDFMA